MKRPIRLALVLILVGGGGGGGGFYYWRKHHHRANARTFVPVKVTRGDLVVAVQATGTVQPENRLVIKPPIGGRIDKLMAKEGDKVEKGQVLAEMSSTDRAALLDVARAKGRAEVKHWEELYRPTPIIAPLAGVIITRNVEPGQVIGATDAVFSMSDHLIVMAQVDETDMAKVKLEQMVTITLDAYPTEHVEGRVHQIAFDARTVSNVTIYDVQILPAAVPEFMRSGMTASIQFKVEERKGVLLVPEAAVTKGKEKGQATVLQRNEDDSESEHAPSSHEVQIGLGDGKLVEVTSGLAEGDTVLQETMKIPEAKGGGSPFSPMGQGKNPGKGR